MSAHKYELMFIADPELDERGLKKLTEQYLETVTKEGGAVENIDIWGRRKLAYEIAGKTEGNYVVVNYSAEPATSDELDRLLNLNESVIRTKILRKEVIQACNSGKSVGNDMAGETVCIGVGYVTADPDIRSIVSCAAVASFTIASTPRTWNRNSNQFEDGQALFLRCSAWRDMAEHCAQSLSMGMRVIAQGRLQKH